MPIGIGLDVGVDFLGHALGVEKVGTLKFRNQRRKLRQIRAQRNSEYADSRFGFDQRRFAFPLVY